MRPITSTIFLSFLLHTTSVSCETLDCVALIPNEPCFEEDCYGKRPLSFQPFEYNDVVATKIDQDVSCDVYAEIDEQRYYECVHKQQVRIPQGAARAIAPD